MSSTMRKRPRGFSLIEVMVASTLFLTTTAVIVASVASATRQNSVQKHMTVALQVAELQLEELLLRFTTSPDIAFTSGLPPHRALFGQDGNPTGVVSPTNFIVEWTVEPVPNITNLRRIALTVKWTDRDRDHTLSLTTDRP